ncbi:hypothetical protein [Streptococcus cuniculi]|uniref:Beta-carotene 15,15'-monooxygenase n=1 Tax=Streptococcus cuniculi TaxID=1432788 RepID=A0A4Y9JAT9_9STRE|nr:hypothetical protein [Streptococcus cuniculi]MBF0778787.1 hypothetical protein [Streptococcus cuniculi]TFU97288.1 hypothetical protein E4T82_08655 [Streptococcus cuniculi]
MQIVNWIVRYQKQLMVGLFLCLALISVYILADSQFILKMNVQSILSLDEKKETVLTLTALTGTTSTAITLIPGDVGTPLAENIADLADYLLIVYAGIWLQKYLVSITSIVAFKWLVPAACILFAGNVYLKKNRLKQLAVRLSLFAAVILFIIPTSVFVSNKIESTYQTSINQTIEAAKEVSETASEQSESSLWEKVTGAAQGLLEKFETAFGNMVDAVAVLIVTTCIIPILVFAFFIWLCNIIFGTRLAPAVPKKRVLGSVIRKRSSM